MHLDLGFEVAISNDRALKKALNAEASKEIGKQINMVCASLLNGLKKQIRRDIKASVVYQGLVGGVLQLELGLAKPQETMERVIDVWTSLFTYDIKTLVDPSGEILLEIVFFYLMDEFWKELTNLSIARYDYFSKRYQMIRQIDWLDWLLTYGTTEFIEGKLVIKSEGFPSSRTGHALMYAVKQPPYWSVSPKYAGTYDDNFLTRALEESLKWFEPEFNRRLAERFK